MRTRRVPTPCIVIFSTDALERRRLVDGNAAGPMLVFEVWIFHRRTEGRELVGLPRSHGRLWFWGGQIVNGFFCGY